MLSTVAAYLLIACFVVLERRLRQGQQASSLEAEESDRGTTRRLGLAFAFTVLVLLMAPALNAFEIGRLSSRAGWTGVGLMVFGLGLRFWANRTLGRFYSRTLRVAEGQRIIQSRPYRVIRHPGYSGVLLMWAGAGLAVSNWIAAMMAVLVTFSSYRYRIQSEERMLLATFGQDYQANMAKTWRLIPLIY
jgi:protein-S-isoprenylcysteine O-methyltransferase Ste14